MTLAEKLAEKYFEKLPLQVIDGDVIDCNAEFRDDCAKAINEALESAARVADGERTIDPIVFSNSEGWHTYRESAEVIANAIRALKSKEQS